MTRPAPVNQKPPTRQRTVLLATDFKNSILTELDAGNPNPIAYSPYGRQSGQLEPMTRTGFNGELREMDLDWYLLGNGYRAYNPRLMRFPVPDNLSPFGKGGRNPYTYCNGEPVMNADPTGHSVWALSRAIERFTGDVQALVTPALNRIATTITKGASQIASTVGAGTSQVTRTIKRAVTDHLWFDADVLKKLGPPPPKVPQKPAQYRNVAPSRPNSVRGQRAFNSLENQGTSRPGAPTTRPISGRPSLLPEAEFNPRDRTMDLPPFGRRLPASHTVVDGMGTKKYVAVVRTAI